MNINQLIKTDPLDVQILKCVQQAKEPISCAQIYEQLKNAPDTRTVSLEVGKLKQRVFLNIAYIAKDKDRNIPRDVAYYQILKAGENYLNTLEVPAIAEDTIDYESVVSTISEVSSVTESTSEDSLKPDSTEPQKPKALQFLELYRSEPQILGVVRLKRR